MNLFAILFSAAFTGNIALTYFLGMCPFIAMSGSKETAYGMGGAVISVMTITSGLNWLIYHLILVPTRTVHLQLLIFILTIAVTVQILEMFLDRFSPTLYASMGIFLPLITVNCAILGANLFMILREYNFMESLCYSFGSGFGWALALAAISGIQEKIHKNSIPEGLHGVGITMITAGIMAMAFTGFAGIL